jgi:hypothetical protein
MKLSLLTLYQGVKMTITDLQKQLEDADKQMTQAVLEHRSEYWDLRDSYFSIYLKLAKAYMDEFIKTRALPVEIMGDENTLYLFDHKDNIYITFRLENKKIATLKFNRYMTSAFRSTSGVKMAGQPVPILGLFPSPLEIVENSPWREEFGDLFKQHPNYDQEFWRTQNHYSVRFLPERGSTLRVSEVAFKTHLFHTWIGKLPEILDFIAQSFEVELHTENMHDVLSKISAQIFAKEERA